MNTDLPLIASREAYTAALKWGLQTAMAQGARRIVCADIDFAHWPLNDALTLQALGAWLRLPRRQLVLLGRHYDDVPRRSPRFVAWRRDWAHAITAWQPEAGNTLEVPSVLVSDGAVCVHLLDAHHWRGRALLDVRYARLQRDQIDVVLQRSEPAFAINTLGL